MDIGSEIKSRNRRKIIKTNTENEVIEEVFQKISKEGSIYFLKNSYRKILPSTMFFLRDVLPFELLSILLSISFLFSCVTDLTNIS